MTFNFKNQFSNITKNPNLTFWLSVLAFSLLTIVAVGRTGSDIISYGLWLYISLYVLKRFSNKFFIAYLIFIFVVSSVYLPVAIFYGRLDMGVIASLYETNLSESTAYMSIIGLKGYLALIIYLLLFITLLKLNKKFTYNNQKKSKKFYALTIIVILAIFIGPITKLHKKKSAIAGFDYYPLAHVADFFSYQNEYFHNKKLLDNSLALKPTWKFNEINPKYDTYVLVIGESVRRDYMSLYDYPINSTPFLKTVNATVFNNFISPSYNTRLSLGRMLFQNKGTDKVIYSNSIISLANSADIETYWLSNQGRYGQYDVLASSVGFRAKHKTFLTGNEFYESDSSDLYLLPPFTKSLAENNNKKKLIVVHLRGSHPPSCKMLDPNYQIKNFNNHVSREISCYLSSLKQTDKLLETIYKQLQATDKPFSLMYVADHGLANKHKLLQGVDLSHEPTYKQNYQVPLIVMSSDDTERKYINAKKSGFQFVNGFAEWLGVEEQSLTTQPTFISDVKSKQVIKVFNGTEVVDYQSLPNDPAIVE